MAIPLIRPGEEVPLYENGEEVARVRVRASELGAVFEVSQRNPGSLTWTRWKPMVEVIPVNGRISYGVYGKRGDEEERT